MKVIQSEALRPLLEAGHPALGADPQIAPAPDDVADLGAEEAADGLRSLVEALWPGRVAGRQVQRKDE